MIVTDKKYYLDNFLLKKLSLMMDRMDDKRRKDNLLLVEGAEGDGKTNASIAIAYYIAFETGRSFNEDNVYFDVQKLIDIAKTKEKQIFIWDEPALSGLTVEWWKKTQIDLIKLLMICRKKRHFFIFNFTKFFKFNEYIVLDRSIGMVHVYSRYTKSGGIQQGRFAYYKKSSLEQLYYYWRSTKRRAYKKYRNFMGSFPWVLPKIIDEVKYELRKDEAILSIGTTEMNKWKLEMLKMQFLAASVEGIDREVLAKFLKTTARTLYRWKNIPKNYPEVQNLLENGGYDD